MRAAARSLWPALLWTTHYFGNELLADGHGYAEPDLRRPCSSASCCEGGCAPAANAAYHRMAAEVKRRRRRQGAVAVASRRAYRREMEQRAAARLPNRTLVPYGAPGAPRPCGQRSYLGEDGSHDALNSLMAVLRARLGAADAPLEPWSVSGCAAVVGAAIYEVAGVAGRVASDLLAPVRT